MLLSIREPGFHDKRIREVGAYAEGTGTRSSLAKSQLLFLMEVKREDPGWDEDGVNGSGECLIANEKSSGEIASEPSFTENKDKSTIKHELDIDKMESMKAEMGEVREENERLKTTMARIAKDYQSLQMHFFAFIHQQQRQAEKPVQTIIRPLPPPLHQEIEETELVSLCLGTVAGGHKKEKELKTPKTPKPRKEDDQMKELNLGLDCKFDFRSVKYSPNLSPEQSLEEPKKEDDQPWQPAKVLKILTNGGADEATGQTTRVLKKDRVSVRARCDAPTMNDGCQWRKYGQKTAKGNPCPRAYYRCTVAPACPVRKQVQRCVDDMSILITTYEGTHNHPLPISATAMASTTSAAACMLMSGSSASQPAIGAPVILNSSHYLDYLRTRQFYSPISPSPPPHNTITLDLTSPLVSSSSSTQLNKFSTNFSSTPSYSVTSLDFSESKASPASWSNGHLSYGSQAYNNRSHVGSFNLGRQCQEPVHLQSYMQNTISSIHTAPVQHPLTDTIAAATKAITSDPSFQSALAAAITSIVGGQGTQSI